MKKLLSAAIVLSAALSIQSAFAADIRQARTARGQPLGAIMIEGKIEQGDFEKFTNFFIDNPRINSAVYLYSPGGNFAEALKIGRLVHTLKLTTWAPQSIEASVPLNEINDQTNRVCASSCFFIFVAGAQRFGEIVGIHRPYLPPEAYKNLSMGEAGRTHIAVAEVVEQYLKEIDVSSSYAARIMAVDSGEIEWLSEEEIKRNFYDFAPAYREWIAAVCSPPSETDKNRMLQILDSTPAQYKKLPVSEVPYPPSDKEFLDKYFAQSDSYYSCRHSAQEREIGRLWRVMYERRAEKVEQNQLNRR